MGVLLGCNARFLVPATYKDVGLVDMLLAVRPANLVFFMSGRKFDMPALRKVGLLSFL